jgi:hypothetical protein
MNNCMEFSNYDRRGNFCDNFPTIKFPSASLNSDDQWALYDLSKGKGLVVDLGCCVGASAAIMSMHAKRVITVDAFWENKEWEERIGYSYELVKKDMERFPNVEVVKSTTADFAKHLEDGSVDLLFIDAGHEYEMVKADDKLYRPKVKEGGIIAFHDFSNYWPGVVEFVNELHCDKTIRGWVAITEKEWSR